MSAQCNTIAEGPVLADIPIHEQLRAIDARDPKESFKNAPSPKEKTIYTYLESVDQLKARVTDLEIELDIAKGELAKARKAFLNR